MIQNHKKIRWENVLKNSISEIHKNQKKEIVFWKKIGMALKQEIIVWKKLVRIWVEHPTFWSKDRKKSPNRVIACFEAIQNHIKNQKIYFIYSKSDWETNSWRFVTPILIPF